MTSLFWLRSLMRLQSDSNWEGVSTKASSLLCLQPGGILSDGDSRCSTRMVLLSYLISPPGLSSRAVGVPRPSVPREGARWQLHPFYDSLRYPVAAFLPHFMGCNSHKSPPKPEGRGHRPCHGRRINHIISRASGMGT